MTIDSRLLYILVEVIHLHSYTYTRMLLGTDLVIQTRYNADFINNIGHGNMYIVYIIQYTSTTLLFKTIINLSKSILKSTGPGFTKTHF